MQKILFCKRTLNSYLPFFGLFFLHFSINSQVLGQDLTIYPASILDAYENGTRDKSGKPGKNYWQNTAVYNMSLKINPYKWTLEGKMQLTYTNNSPDTLSELWFNVYPEVFKKGTIRDWPLQIENISNGVEFLSIVLKEKKIDLSDPTQFFVKYTNLRLKTDGFKLNPSESIEVEMEWKINLPKKVHADRMGGYDATTSFVAYFYPQIAVYDDIAGWDRLSYGGLHEFYRNYVDFNVDITMPKSFLIWATGTLKNPRDVYSSEILNKWRTSKKSDKMLTIVSGAEDYPKEDGEETWTFNAENVIDFAFGYSNHFRWDASSVNLDIKSNEHTHINTVYDAKHKQQLTSHTKEQKQLMEYFSNEFPGVAYPYPSFTNFMGNPVHHGMEYPMIVNDGVYSGNKYPPTFKDVRLSAHEMAHTYFPYYVGINERKYAWMEEGWAVFLTTKVLSDKNSPLYYEVPRNRELMDEYLGKAGTIYDPSLMTTSILMGNWPTHRHISYVKPFVAYSVLENLLGEKVFKECTQEYMAQWAGKHPMPYDFFFTYNNISGQNLNWFWKKWFQDFAHADLGLAISKKGTLTVLNEGGLPMPFSIELTYANGTKDIVSQKADVWKDKDSFTIPIDTNKTLKSAQLLTNIWPDTRKGNNTINQ